MSIKIYSMAEMQRLLREGGFPMEAPIISNAQINTPALDNPVLDENAGDPSTGASQQGLYAKAGGIFHRTNSDGAVTGVIDADGSPATDWVDQDGIAADAVGQGELKRGDQEDDQEITSGSIHVFNFTGNVFTLGWGLTHTANARGLVLADRNETVYKTTIEVVNEAAVNTTFRFKAMYVQGSPPYNLGSGDIPLFVFVRLRPDGSISGISVAPDPPWANNGPTKCNPANRARVGSERDNDGYLRPRWYKEPVQPKPAPGASESEIDAYLARLGDPTNEEHWRWVEIDQTLKNRDMHLIPHPFVGNDLDGDTVVMLDPCGPMMERLYEIHRLQMDGERVSDLLQEGWLEIDGRRTLDAAAPPGVLNHPVRWKSTG